MQTLGQGGSPASCAYSPDMIRATPRSMAPRLPATVGLGLAALLVTVLSWSGRNIDALDITYRAWEGEPWRLVTSALPHVGPLHLLFNLYWLWRLGALLEQRYGAFKTLTFYALVAIGSAAAEHALFRGGVGLSGVGYGIVGFLTVAHRRDPELSDAMDEQTTRLFILWFFLCIAATVTNVMPVANVAHGAGFVLGSLFGLAATAKAGARWTLASAAGALLIASLVASAWLRPWVNWGEGGGLAAWADAEAGYQREDYAESERLYLYATSVDPEDARMWFNLGVTRAAAEKADEALSAYQRAVELAPSEERYRHAVETTRAFIEQRAAGE